RYEGPEGWDNWIFCSMSRHSGGWVPEQIIERLPGDAGRALEDYSAREMNVDPGDQVLGERTLNAWCWCRRPLGWRQRLGPPGQSGSPPRPYACRILLYLN